VIRDGFAQLPGLGVHVERRALPLFFGVPPVVENVRGDIPEATLLQMVNPRVSVGGKEFPFKLVHNDVPPGECEILGGFLEDAANGC
jgi:hypothetical protein